MPRYSKRVIAINELSEAVVSNCIYSSATKLLLEESDEDYDSDEEDELLRGRVTVATYYAVCNMSRYLFREDYYRPDVRMKGMGSALPHWYRIVTGKKYNNEEFLKMFRVPRECFNSLVRLLKDHHSFGKHGLRQRMHFSVQLHLLVLLKLLGSEGNAASALSVKQGLGIGKGSVLNYVRRAVDAVLSLFDDTVFWPDAEERVEISNRREKFHFPKCVGFVDGTHLGLAYKPEVHGEEYFTCKQQYAINSMVICDDCRRIRYINIGWPGSVHDQRIFSNSIISRTPDSFFSDKEYLIGDSAYSNSAYMVPAYKKFGGQVALSAGQNFFNDLLSSPRSTAEHTIGILKARFPFLRQIRIRIRDKNSMLELIRIVKAAVVLHNLFVQKHEVPMSWFSSNDLVEPDLVPQLDEEIYLSPSSLLQRANEGSRREEVHNFLSAKLQ
jgi:hypothetical protein